MDVDLTTLATLAAGVGSLAAAIAAWRAASSTRDAVRAQIILDFSKRDAQQEFGDAIKTLWDFKDQSEENIADRFERLESESKIEWEKIDNARRIVHKFWRQLMSLKQAGLISDKELLLFFFKPQLTTILEILEPLESKKPGFGYSKPAFDEYRRIYENYEEMFKDTYGVALKRDKSSS
jgi:hypothetical protein